MLAEARFDGQHTGRRPTATVIRASPSAVNSQIAGPLVRLLREGHWAVVTMFKRPGLPLGVLASQEL